MNEIKELLKSREKQLLNLKKEIEKSLKKAPKGTLRICKSKNRTQFYHRTNPKDFSGKYIPKKNHILAKNLAQKDYNQKLLVSIEKEICSIQKYLQTFPNTCIEELFSTLHPERQNLIIPVYEPDDIFVTSWNAVQYEGKFFNDYLPEYFTSKGERVRSKSEIIIADTLENNDVPYRYEYPLYLKGFGQIYPDFTVLNVRTRKEFVWEHFGMMDDPIYAENAIQKIATYEQNGFFPGINLLLTYETKNNPINQKSIHLLIQAFLK